MPDYYVGLMSGTSVDSIDAALVDFSTSQPYCKACLNRHWPVSIRNDIFATRQLADNRLGSLQALDDATGKIFAQAVIALLQQADIRADEVRAIGSHGQTIRHRPDIKQPFSLQIGNPALIANLTHIPVVADFRSADIRAGGQGAPLVPAFHQAVFSSQQHNRVIVNIGGIANITVLPKQSNGQASSEIIANKIIGFDTGPGNSLMDAWIYQQTQQAYDHNGDFAASGISNKKLLTSLLADNYFQQPPPKSTGFECFNLPWLEQHLQGISIQPQDVQSTLCDLTAHSIIQAIKLYADKTNEIYICGGGVHNTTLMQRLQALTTIPIRSTTQLGVQPDWVEAMTFAWLAKCRLANIPGNIPAVTGAREQVILGDITCPVS